MASLGASHQLFRDEIDKAWSSLMKQDFTAAMLHAKQASTIGPDLPETAHILGLLASRDNRSDIAIPLLQKALDLEVTERRLRDMAEAQLIAGYPDTAKTYIQQAIKSFEGSAETLGLFAAIEVALENYQTAQSLATKAIIMKPHLMAWEGTLAFCHLIRLELVNGFKCLTGRSQNLLAGSRSPFFNQGVPDELWLKNEQGPGDTLFYTRFAAHIAKLGCKIHLQTDKKTKVILRNTGLFASVKEDLSVPAHGFWLRIGDLPLASIQAGSVDAVQPLQLQPEQARVDKIKNKLAQFGPAPYIAVTWRAGARGKKQRAGLRMYDKYISPELFGELLSNTNATIISVQRVPDADEEVAFKKALGRNYLDYSHFNDNLQDMLALLSVVDTYVTVPNTNVHLRESLAMPSEVLVNRPYQDWRWLAVEQKSVWYPCAQIHRQASDGSWSQAIAMLKASLSKYTSSETPQIINQVNQVAIDQQDDKIEAGWNALNSKDISTAISIAQSVLSKAPNHPQALHLLGWAALKDAKLDLALKLLESAYIHATHDGRILGDFIRMLAMNNQLDRAIAFADDALNFDNPSLINKSGVFFARAACLIQHNRLQEAIHDFYECYKINESRLDAIAFSGMARLKLGDARQGFRDMTFRKEAQREELLNSWVCPVLRGDIKGLRILIKRDMGLGDELSYLRYLPWLVEAGAIVDYWAGKKLVSLLARTGLFHQVFSDENKAPDSANYDLSFIISELPIAVEHLNAPAIAQPLPLTSRKNNLHQWRQWLSTCGPAPYIGLTWQAGTTSTNKFTDRKLGKSILATLLAEALRGVKGTLILLQRNTSQQDIDNISAILDAPVHNFSALTDDLEDITAILSLLDENIGVSNTNMHIRAGLGLSSRVLTQNVDGDWRWGAEATESLWFPDHKVYRETTEGWASAISELNKDLLKIYGTWPQSPLFMPKPEYQNAWQHIRHNQLSLAVQEATKLLKDKESPEALHVLGYAAFKEAKYEIANALLERALELNSTEAFLFADFARIQVALKKTDVALTAINKALNLDANQDRFWALKGFICFQLEQFNESKVAYKIATSLNPNSGDHTYNLARLNLLDGELGAGFRHFTSRPTLQSIGAYVPLPNQKITGKKILIKHQMGIGSELLFVSYIKNLMDQGAEVTYQAGKKLYPLLKRHSFCNHILNANDVVDETAYDCVFLLPEVTLLVKELAYPEHIIQLTPLPEKLIKWKSKLEEIGPGPYIGLTWRAGTTDEKEALVKSALIKTISHKQIAESLQGLEATFVSVQRSPKPNELNELSHGFGKTVYDLSASAEDLEDTLALMSLMDEYVTVSNTNVYFRESLGKTSRVLVNAPPSDWRWDVKGNVSPWFKHATVYRQALDSSWAEALSNLAIELAQQLCLNFKNQNVKKQKAVQQQNTAKPRVLWLTAGQLLEKNNELTSPLASARYRVIQPIKQLSAKNWNIEIINEQVLNSNPNTQPKLAKNDLVIVSKVFSVETLNYLKYAKEIGAKILVDFCDNHFSNPKRAPLQHALLNAADNVVVSTDSLAESLLDFGRKPDAIISDPVELQKGDAYFNPSEQIKLLWFGHAVNIDTLAQFLPVLAKYANIQPLTLNVVTTLPNGDDDLRKIVPNGLSVTYTSWSVESTQKAIADCDLVIIPTLETELKKAKSPNRLLEPLWSGRYVVAGSLPAYIEFADYAWVNNDLIAGIDWAIKNKVEVRQKITLAQEIIFTKFSATSIADRWESVITATTQLNSTNQLRTEIYSNSTISAQSEAISTSQSDSRKVAILSNQNPTLPSIGIRLIEPLSQLQSMVQPGLATSIKDGVLKIDHQVLTDADFIIVHRDFPSDETLPIIQKYKNLNKRIIYETDDAFHLIPKEHAKHHHLKNIDAINACISMADEVIVSTPKLLSEYAEAKKLRCIPNRLSPTLWNEKLLSEASSAKLRCGDKAIRIGIIGGANHQTDLLNFMEVIDTLNTKYHHLKWIAYGEAAEAATRAIPDSNKEIITGKWNYRNHPQRLAELALDIILVPLENNDFNQCISNLKFLEAGFLGVPGVFADMAPYAKTVKHGVNGYLAKQNPEEWITYASALIDNKNTRETLGNNAQTEVTSHWLLTPENNQWSELFLSYNRQSVKQTEQVTEAGQFKRKIGYLSAQSPNIPSNIICLIEPFKHLDSYCELVACNTVDKNGKVQIDADINQCEAIIIVRDFVSDDTLSMLQELSKSKHLIYFMDDALHKIPKTHHKSHHLKNANAIKKFAKVAHQVVTTTALLAKQLDTTATKHVIPNLLSANYWNTHVLGAHLAARSKHPVDTIRVGLVGGSDHLDDFQMIKQAIQALSDEHPSIIWVALGDGASQIIQSINNARHELSPSNYYYPNYPMKLANMALDIILVPLRDNLFNQCKSNIKFLESGFLGIPGVFSKLTTYDSIQNGVNGMLVGDSATEWKEAISALILDAELRKAIGEKARKTVITQGTLSTPTQGWRKVLSAVDVDSEDDLIDAEDLEPHKPTLVKTVTPNPSWLEVKATAASKVYPPATQLKSPPLVSIIIASYNHAHFIIETLQSIDAIKYPNIEVVIVDDRSTDNSVEVIQQWQEHTKRKVVFEINPKNSGTGKTLQRASKIATGSYLAPFASDDVFLPNAFDGVIDLMEAKPENVLFISSGVSFDRAGLTVRNNNQALFSELYKGPQSALVHFYTNVSSLFIQACIIKKEFFNEIGGFPLSAPSEDWALVVKMFEHFASGKGQYLLAPDNIVFGYRRHQSNVSKNKKLQMVRKLHTVRVLTPKPLKPYALVNIYKKEIRMSRDASYQAYCESKVKLWQQRVKPLSNVTKVA